MQRREFINLSSLFSIILIIFNIKILIDTLNLKQYDSLNLIKSKDGYKAFITHLPPKLKVGAENKIQKVA